MGSNSSGIFARGALSAALVTGVLLMDHVGMAMASLLVGMLVIGAALAMGATLAFAVNAWSRVRHLERVVGDLRRSGEQLAAPAPGDG
jgi:hypothetical protein